MMNSEEFLALAQKRCDLAEVECSEFQELEKRCYEAFHKKDIELFCDLVLQLRSVAEVECYKKGFSDALSINTKHVAKICSHQ